MNWEKLPPGMTRHDELLAILDSLRFTLHRADRGGNPEYVAGFDDALSAVARSLGLHDYLSSFLPVVSIEPLQISEGAKK